MYCTSHNVNLMYVDRCGSDRELFLYRWPSIKYVPKPVCDGSLPHKQHCRLQKEPDCVGMLGGDCFPDVPMRDLSCVPLSTASPLVNMRRGCARCMLRWRWWKYISEGWPKTVTSWIKKQQNKTKTKKINTKRQSSWILSKVKYKYKKLLYSLVFCCKLILLVFT